MSNEHHSTEHGETNEQASVEIDALAAERLAEIRGTTVERDPSDQSEKRAEKAREAIHEQTKEAEPEPANASEDEKAAPVSRVLPFLNQHLNYSQTLASVQRKLNPASRSFSKVIHAPLIEATSEALEGTVARPSVLLGATWTALIIGSIFYFTARYYGYALSGSELLFSFLAGGLLGIALEGLWRVLKRR